MTGFSFMKNVQLPFFFGESANLQLRANFFNIFNQLNLQPLPLVAGARTRINHFSPSREAH